MTDKEYIRKAVELADDFLFKPYHDNGFRFLLPNEPDGHYNELIRGFDNLPQWYLDALAAQLVRQVDALAPKAQRPFISWESTSISGLGMIGPDRTMNTIKAIIDSGVLNERTCTSNS